MEYTAKCEARAVDGMQGAVQKEGVISGLSLWRRHYYCQGAVVPAVCCASKISTRRSGCVDQDTLFLKDVGYESLRLCSNVPSWASPRGGIWWYERKLIQCSVLRDSCAPKHLLHSFNDFSVVLKYGLAIQVPRLLWYFSYRSRNDAENTQIVGSLGLNEMFWVQCL